MWCELWGHSQHTHKHAHTQTRTHAHSGLSWGEFPGSKIVRFGPGDIDSCWGECQLPNPVTCLFFWL